MLCLLAAHDVGLNLCSQLHPGEIPVTVGIVEPMHSSLLPLCRTHQRAGSEAQMCRVHLPLPGLRPTYDKGRAVRLFNQKGHRDTETRGFFSSLTSKCCSLIIHFVCFCSHPTLWRPEYGSYMIEGTPGQPYGGTMSEFNTVEGNMRKRRREASSVLNPRETLCTVTAFPRCFSLYWSKVFTLIKEVNTNVNL